MNKPKTFVMLTIKPDGSQVELRMSNKPTLEELQAAVGGYIADITKYCCYTVPDYPVPAQVYVDEDGHPKALPFNQLGTHLAGFTGGYCLVGNVVIVYEQKSEGEPK